MLTLLWCRPLIPTLSMTACVRPQVTCLACSLPCPLWPILTVCGQVLSPLPCKIACRLRRRLCGPTATCWRCPDQDAHGQHGKILWFTRAGKPNGALQVGCSLYCPPACAWCGVQCDTGQQCTSIAKHVRFCFAPPIDHAMSISHMQSRSAVCAELCSCFVRLSAYILM